MDKTLPGMLLFGASLAFYSRKRSRSNPQANSLQDEGTVRKIHDGDEFSSEYVLHKGDIVIVASAHDLNTRSMKPRGSQLSLYQLEEQLEELLTPLVEASQGPEKPLQVVEAISESLVSFIDSCDKRVGSDDPDDLEQHQLVKLISKSVGSGASSDAPQAMIFVSSFSLSCITVGKSMYLRKGTSRQRACKLRSVTNPASNNKVGALKDFMVSERSGGGGGNKLN